jgi:hypothetical protein
MPTKGYPKRSVVLEHGDGEDIDDQAPLPCSLPEVTETSDRGGVTLQVTVNDSTSEMLDLDFLQELHTGTLAVATDPASRVIALDPGHGLTPGTVPGTSVYPDGDVGTVLEVGVTSSGRFIQAKILAISGDDITINQLVGDVFPIGAPVMTGNRNLALADGSTTPVIFKVEPSPAQAGDIVRIVLVIVGPSAMDFTGFGSNGVLPIGLLFRVRRGDGSYKNLRTVDQNLEGSLWGFDTSSFTPKQGNTDHALAFRVTFGGWHKHGAVARLDGTLGVGEQFECVVLDDMITRSDTIVRVIAQGSELQELPPP